MSDRASIVMDRFTVRLPHDLAGRFDAAAASRGGRSRLLRRLIEASADRIAPGSPVTSGEALAGKLTLRLGATDLASVERAAVEAGLSRTQWIRALVLRKLHARPQLSPPEALAFVEVQRDLRRIGVNVNQIARAMNTAVLEGRVLELELAQVRAFADEIRAGLAGLRSAFEGNLDYWSDAP